VAADFVPLLWIVGTNGTIPDELVTGDRERGGALGTQRQAALGVWIVAEQ
jgi:hypothetical protein